MYKIVVCGLAATLMLTSGCGRSEVAPGESEAQEQISTELDEVWLEAARLRSQLEASVRAIRGSGCGLEPIQKWRMPLEGRIRALRDAVSNCPAIGAEVRGLEAQLAELAELEDSNDHQEEEVQ